MWRAGRGTCRAGTTAVHSLWQVRREPCGVSREGKRGAVGAERDFGPHRSEEGALAMVRGREVT